MVIKTFEEVVSLIDDKISKLKDKNITPKIIILGKVNFFTVTARLQKVIPEDWKADLNIINDSSVSSEFYYRELPIYFNSTLKLPGLGDLVEVYGD